MTKHKEYEPKYVLYELPILSGNPQITPIEVPQSNPTPLKAAEDAFLGYVDSDRRKLVNRLRKRSPSSAIFVPEKDRKDYFLLREIDVAALGILEEIPWHEASKRSAKYQPKGFAEGHEDFWSRSPIAEDYPQWYDINGPIKAHKKQYEDQQVTIIRKTVSYDPEHWWLTPEEHLTVYLKFYRDPYDPKLSKKFYHVEIYVNFHSDDFWAWHPNTPPIKVWKGDLTIPAAKALGNMALLHRLVGWMGRLHVPLGYANNYMAESVRLEVDAFDLKGAELFSPLSPFKEYSGKVMEEHFEDPAKAQRHELRVSRARRKLRDQKKIKEKGKRRW